MDIGFRTLRAYALHQPTSPLSKKLQPCGSSCVRDHPSTVVNLDRHVLVFEVRDASVVAAINKCAPAYVDAGTDRSWLQIRSLGALPEPAVRADWEFFKATAHERDT